MPRAIWSGALTFGLVNVPVKLFTAVSQKEVRFHLLHGADGARVRLKRFCGAEEREVPLGEIVRGFEVGRDRYVVVTDEELAAAAPRASRTIEIRDFVELARIDPIYFDRTYYLVPDATAAKAYRLLAEAMRRTGKVAVASFVLRTREQLCCVRPLEEALAVSTMNRADEVVPVSTLDLPRGGAPTEREVQMAEQLVASLAAPFEPERYPDVHRERVLALVERKAAGEAITPAPEEEAPAKVVSLADALAASLAAARGRARPDEAAAAGGAPVPARGQRRHAAAAAARTARKPGRKRRA